MVTLFKLIFNNDSVATIVFSGDLDKVLALCDEYLAIPLLVTHSVLMAKTSEIVDSLEMASVRTLSIITKMARRQSVAAAA